MVFNISKFKEKANSSMENGKISPNTAKLYLYCLNKLNDALPDNPTSEEIRDAIMDMGNSAQAYRDAVSFYEKKVIKSQLMNPVDKTSIKVKQQVRELDYMPRYYIERVRKSKYKFAFMVQLKGGLRINEIAQLIPEDFEINGDQITINVRHGKGGKQRYVHCLPSTYLLKEIPNFEKMPSYAALKAEASNLGFRTHDLRKVNARSRFWRERENGKTKKQALYAIKDELGHVSTRETLKYVGAEYKKKKNDWKY